MSVVNSKNVTTKSQGTRRGGGGAGGKTCPFPRTFCGKEKKMFATIFFSYIHVKNKEGITVAEKMQ